MKTILVLTCVAVLGLSTGYWVMLEQEKTSERAQNAATAQNRKDFALRNRVLYLAGKEYQRQLKKAYWPFESYAPRDPMKLTQLQYYYWKKLTCDAKNNSGPDLPLVFGDRG